MTAPFAIGNLFASMTAFPSNPLPSPDFRPLRDMVLIRRIRPELEGLAERLIVEYRPDKERIPTCEGIVLRAGPKSLVSEGAHVICQRFDVAIDVELNGEELLMFHGKDVWAVKEES